MKAAEETGCVTEVCNLAITYPMDVISAISPPVR